MQNGVAMELEVQIRLPLYGDNGTGGGDEADGYTTTMTDRTRTPNVSPLALSTTSTQFGAILLTERPCRQNIFGQPQGGVQSTNPHDLLGDNDASDSWATTRAAPVGLDALFTDMVHNPTDNDSMFDFSASSSDVGPAVDLTSGVGRVSYPIWEYAISPESFEDVADRLPVQLRHSRERANDNPLRRSKITSSMSSIAYMISTRSHRPRVDCTEIVIRKQWPRSIAK